LFCLQKNVAEFLQLQQNSSRNFQSRGKKSKLVMKTEGGILGGPPGIRARTRGRKRLDQKEGGKLGRKKPNRLKEILLEGKKSWVPHLRPFGASKGGERGKI